MAARVAADEHTKESGSWVPNACEIYENGHPCQHRDECFSAFGKIDTGPAGQVGLYPYNPISLRRAFRHLRDGNRLLPRSLVNNVVHDFLITADPEIGAGIFPTEHISGWLFLGIDRAREAIVREDELPSPEARERLRRARIGWADGEPEPSGVHEAFDLPGTATAAAPQTGNAKASPVVVPRPDIQWTALSPPQADRAQSLYDWESNVTPLPDHEMEAFRTAFYGWTLARLDLGRQLINAGSGTIKFILSSIIREWSFVIDYAGGRRPAEGDLRFDVPQSPKGLRLLLAARWFADHGHWNSTDPNRKWEFPSGFQSADLQIELENFLSHCTAHVERRFLQSITSTGGVRRLQPLSPSGARPSGPLACWSRTTLAGSSPQWLKTEATSPTFGRRPGRNLPDPPCRSSVNSTQRLFPTSPRPVRAILVIRSLSTLPSWSQLGAWPLMIRPQLSHS